MRDRILISMASVSEHDLTPAEERLGSVLDAMGSPLAFLEACLRVVIVKHPEFLASGGAEQFALVAANLKAEIEALKQVRGSSMLTAGRRELSCGRTLVRDEHG